MRKRLVPIGLASLVAIAVFGYVRYKRRKEA